MGSRASLCDDLPRRGPPGGHADGNELFEAILNPPSGVVFTRDEYGDDFARVIHPDRRIALELPEMLDELLAIVAGPVIHTTDRFPIVLSVGERRSFTANDIFRNPAWRKQDTDGRLRVSAEDATRLGLVDGARAVITTTRGSAEAVVEVSDVMPAGHASLPNGFGLEHTGPDGEIVDGSGRLPCDGLDRTSGPSANERCRAPRVRPPALRARSSCHEHWRSRRHRRHR